MYPDRGGVGRDIDQLTNRSLVDLVNVDIELDLKHLSGDIKEKVRRLKKIKKMALRH